MTTSTATLADEARVDITYVAAAAGITPKQADHWTRQGWLVATQERAGTGFPRSYDLAQVEVARVMGELGRLLGVRASVAYPVARALLDHGHHRVGDYTLTRSTS